MFGVESDSLSHDSSKDFGGFDFYEKYSKLKRDNQIFYARKDLEYKSVIDSKIRKYEHEILENRKQARRKHENDKREIVRMNYLKVVNHVNKDPEVEYVSKNSRNTNENAVDENEIEEEKPNINPMLKTEKMRAAEAIRALRYGRGSDDNNKKKEEILKIKEFEKCIRVELRRKELERRQKSKQYLLQERIRKEDEKFLIMKKDKELLYRQQKEDAKQAMLKKFEIKSKSNDIAKEVEREMKKAAKMKLKLEYKNSNNDVM